MKTNLIDTTTSYLSQSVAMMLNFTAFALPRIPAHTSAFVPMPGIISKYSNLPFKIYKTLSNYMMTTQKRLKTSNIFI